MSLYNISNFSSQPNPGEWYLTANNLSEGVLSVGLICVIYIVIFSVLAAKGLSKYAFVSTNFICFSLSLFLFVWGAISGYAPFVLAVLTAIGVVILVFDKGY